MDLVGIIEFRKDAEFRDEYYQQYGGEVKKLVVFMNVEGQGKVLRMGKGVLEIDLVGIFNFQQLYYVFGVMVERI